MGHFYEQRNDPVLILRGKKDPWVIRQGKRQCHMCHFSTQTSDPSVFILRRKTTHVSFLQGRGITHRAFLCVEKWQNSFYSTQQNYLRGIPRGKRNDPRVISIRREMTRVFILRRHMIHRSFLRRGSVLCVSSDMCHLNFLVPRSTGACKAHVDQQKGGVSGQNYDCQRDQSQQNNHPGRERHWHAGTVLLVRIIRTVILSITDQTLVYALAARTPELSTTGGTL